MNPKDYYAFAGFRTNHDFSYTDIRFAKKADFQPQPGDIQEFINHFGDEDWEADELIGYQFKDTIVLQDFKDIQAFIKEKGFKWSGCTGPIQGFYGYISNDMLEEWGFTISDDLQQYTNYELSIDAY